MFKKICIFTPLRQVKEASLYICKLGERVTERGEGGGNEGIGKFATPLPHQGGKGYRRVQSLFKHNIDAFAFSPFLKQILKLFLFCNFIAE